MDPALDIKTSKKHDKPAHIKQRADFFDFIASQLNIPGMTFTRDHNFDDIQKMRSAGIRGEYHSHFSAIPSLKPGVVLELGFDQTTPNLSCDISSWAFDKVMSLDIAVIDNCAKNIKCYYPEYTFVEKLQTISTKFRLHALCEATPKIVE